MTFNAWVYSGSAHLWASLITHLYGAVERYLGWRAWYFRLEQTFRRSISRLLGLLTLYGLVGFGISFLLDFEAIRTNWQQALKDFNNLIAALLGGSALLTLPRLIESVRDLVKSMVVTRAKKLQEVSTRPDFGEHIGVMDDIKREIGTISKLLKRGKRGRPTRLVLFIDDLDRCTHNKAVEVLQAIMLLLADEDGAPFVIFIGIDARVIVKAIEENYGKVLVDAGITGYEYLDKIIQIPFTIPPASELALVKYVDSLIWGSEEKKQAILETQDQEDETLPDDRGKEDEGSEGKDEVLKLPDGGDEQLQISPGMDGHSSSMGDPELNRTDTLDSLPEVVINQIPVTLPKKERDAFKFFTADLIPNPRRIKRMVNVYRFVRQLMEFPEAEQDERRAKQIRWIILSEQWPFRTAWMLQEIEDIDQRGKLTASYRKKPLSNVYEIVKPQVLNEEMEKFLEIDNDPDLFNRFIQNWKKNIKINGEAVPEYVINGTHITVDDIEGVREPLRYGLRQLTFNLNPAIQHEVSKFATKVGGV